MDELERELRQALERRPAPPSLKRRVMERRERESGERAHRRVVFWQRLAAAATLAGALAGVFVWHDAAERRKGEEARQQVLTALRITSRALNQMEEQLAASGRNTQE
jgi:hypothetical protein